MNIKKKKLYNSYKKLITSIIKTNQTLKKSSGRKDKFHINSYLNPILDVLFLGHKWENVHHIKGIDISTIRKKFYKWRDDGVFMIAFEQLKQRHLGHKKFKELFIDSTCVQNMNGSSDLIKYYYKIKSKKQLKITICSTMDNIPLAVDFCVPTKHDSQGIKSITDSLKRDPVIQLQKGATITGDKGYISKQKIYEIKGIRTRIITPKRKNQKKRKNTKTKKLLKKRYSIEQTISHLKGSYVRLAMIYDRDIENYKTFFIMGLTCQILRKGV